MNDTGPSGLRPPAGADGAQTGPELRGLLRRLTECPSDFLAEPLLQSSGTVDTAAVVSDLLADLGSPPLTSDPLTTARSGEDRVATRNRLRVVLVVAWLLHDEWFVSRRVGPAALPLLSGGLDELARLVPAEQFVADPDRREELVRTCLQALGLRPAGESPEAAQDRLTTLSTAERARVIQATRAAEARARQVREQLARKAAEEAAAAYSGE